MFCEKDVISCQTFLTGDCLFPGHFKIRAGSFLQKVRCSGARDVLITGELHRTTNCSIEHFDLGKGKGCPFKRGKPRFCKYLPVSVH